MWSAPAIFHSPIVSTSFSNRRNCRNLALKASLFDYPLASRIMVKNIPYSTRENVLHKEFSAFGEIAEVKLVKDEFTKRPKGYAFIQYTSQDDAMLALENMDQTIYNGRVIYVDIAKPGKDAFGGFLRTSGPPKKQQMHQAADEVADCWY